jgi:predicted nucleic acid-binding Zn ribbon protein
MKRHNDHTLKEVLQQLLEQYKLKPRLNQSRINQIWAEKMGTTINKYTRDLKVVRTTLYISIESAPLRQELTYNKDKIREMVNEELGEEYIKVVVVR